MITRTELASALFECLAEVENLIERAHAVALKQQSALVDNDAEEIAVTSRVHDEIIRRIVLADQRAASVGDQLLAAAGLDPEEAGPESVVAAAGPALAGAISAALSRIAGLSTELRAVTETNHRLLSNGMEIIACCLRAVAGEPAPNAYYSSDAGLSNPGAQAISLNFKV